MEWNGKGQSKQILFRNHFAASDSKWNWSTTVQWWWPWISEQIVFNLRSNQIFLQTRMSAIIFTFASICFDLSLRRTHTCSIGRQCAAPVRDSAIIKRDNRQLFALFDYYLSISIRVVVGTVISAIVASNPFVGERVLLFSHLVLVSRPLAHKFDYHYSRYKRRSAQ